ncbi:citryl-CoA lyase [Leekyejoonella antrihumi]|uniref:citrate synthase (unknown stereospecificity) n=1 Tax=Leekyejoonella antrihumi TaxID=1660198 RepID=A0A563DXF4_9MICO|nr:citryl-CoA lyase [Leekyejoonella antrihumi]TWP34940.1 citryl-CoA lyase [Leekyejoonella antrihumi]
MARPRNPITSQMGWSTKDRIVVRGHDLPSELLGHVGFGDMAYLEVMGRLPDEHESVVFNSLLVTLVEHGMTPSAIAARLTYLGAPESLQSAVAAGILGVGSVFVGTTEGAANFLSVAITPDTNSADVPALAKSIVTEARESKKPIAGIGHPVHKPVDPRVPRLFEIAEAHGFRGLYVALLEAVAEEASAQYDRVLPINATGAIGALLCELGFDTRVARGLGTMARAVGLVGHLAEEMDNPMARELWFRVEDEVVEASGGAS